MASTGHESSASRLQVAVRRWLRSRKADMGASEHLGARDGARLFYFNEDRSAPSGGPLFRKHAEVLTTALGATLSEGNAVRVLVNGPPTYEAMFRAIEGARDHINIESYIIDGEGPGKALADLLLAKRREGVRINVLFDSFGSLSTDRVYFDMLRDAGIAVWEFNPLRPLRNLLNRAFHLRDHRKLLIVDGRIAFIGGVNISSVYSPGLSKPDEKEEATQWRDTHLEIRGPVVKTLQRLFLDHWRSQSGRPAQRALYFPTLQPCGGQRIGVAACDAGRRRNPFYRSLVSAIDAAEERILVTVAYFVPPRRIVRALVRAARRGVEVRLMLPGFSDVWASLHAGRSLYGRLLHAGVKIYELHDAFLHAKTTVIDGVWATVGSSNMDWRSYLHNAEANVIVLDTGLAREMEDLFWQDVEIAQPVTLEAWRGRGTLQRLAEWLARKFQFFL